MVRNDYKWFEVDESGWKWFKMFKDGGKQLWVVLKD